MASSKNTVRGIRDPIPARTVIANLGSRDAAPQHVPIQALAASMGGQVASPPGTGTVTSLAVTGSTGITVGGSPVTDDGTITLALGDITPDSVAAAGAVSGTDITASGDVAGVNVTASAAVQGATVKATAVAGFISSDGSAGFTGTVTTASLVGKTVTIKDGIITNVA